MIVER